MNQFKETATQNQIGPNILQNLEFDLLINQSSISWVHNIINKIEPFINVRSWIKFSFMDKNLWKNALSKIRKVHCVNLLNFTCSTVQWLWSCSLSWLQPAHIFQSFMFFTAALSHLQVTLMTPILLGIVPQFSLFLLPWSDFAFPVFSSSFYCSFQML